MNAPKSMTGIAHDLATNRTAKRLGRMAYVVMPLPRTGTVKIRKDDMLYNATETYEQAIDRKAIMERLNPRRRYTIVTL